MEWAWLIPVFSFGAVPLIILFGKYLPGKGSPLAILAIAGGFALFWFVLVGFLGASPGTEGCTASDQTGTLTCEYQRTWFRAGLPGQVSNIDESIHLNWGILIDPLTLVMLG